MAEKINNDRARENLESLIASFAVEDIIPSTKAIKYCKLRDMGERSCKEEIMELTKKYKDMARK